MSQDLGRVLLNLLSNAFYAVQQRQLVSAPGYVPTVSVGNRRSGKQLQVTVRDNGTGMLEAVRQKIFQPFFTTKPAGAGTGLGLSLSHDIVVKSYGGTLDVASQGSIGTEITRCLPLAAG